MKYSKKKEGKGGERRRKEEMSGGERLREVMSEGEKSDRILIFPGRPGEEPWSQLPGGTTPPFTKGARTLLRRPSVRGVHGRPTLLPRTLRAAKGGRNRSTQPIPDHHRASGAPGASLAPASLAFPTSSTWPRPRDTGALRTSGAASRAKSPLVG